MSKGFSLREMALVLLICVLIAGGVCLLHSVNAFRLCGTLQAEELEEIAEYVPEIESVLLQRGNLYVTGYLAKPGKKVGSVRVRLGLLLDGQVILLNTEMVRRSDIAEKMACDDHCGAAAAVRVADLTDGEYEIVFVDQLKKIIRTGNTLLIRDGDAEWKKS